MILRACIRCGKPGPQNYCEAHQPQPWEGSKRSESVTLSGSKQQARRKRIIERYLHCCHVCGGVFPLEELEVDHVRSLGEGGSDTDENCRPICIPDHRAKTAKEAARAKAVGAAMVRKRYSR